MRLLNVHRREFREFYDNTKRPRYAIASHRWQMPFEATYKDVLKKTNVETPGYRKVLAFCRYVEEFLPEIDWIWIDTCCIDKKNATELQTSINLMFEWYRDAEIGLAFLADVHTTRADDLGRSEWFKRGWTLQELLAPRTVVFLASDWRVIGRKGPEYDGMTSLPLERLIAEITHIPESVLLEYNESLRLTVQEKMRWMDGRVTTLPEDKAYALYGICNVCPGVNYGEGGKGAQERLMSALNRHRQTAIDHARRFEIIRKWLAPPDPWTTHDSSRQRHEPGTGAWLLHSEEFRSWKNHQRDGSRHLWVYGPPGCGKTILASTAIEDVRAHCETKSDSAQAIFYFTFSDTSKQTYDNLVRSLLAQLAYQGEGFSSLERAYEKAGSPSWNVLEKILSICIASYQTVFLHIDAFDECRHDGDIRVDVLARLEDLLLAHPNIRVIATSRDVVEVRSSMQRINARQLCASSRTVDQDIHRYIATQLSRDSRLSSLQPPVRELIQSTLAKKANGMFRWVFCQLEELRNFKSTKPSFIKAALQKLPKTLDETYQRMLLDISENDRADALTLLRWIAFAHRPLSLEELAEATIIDLANARLELEDRGDWHDPLAILSGLVVVEPQHIEMVDFDDIALDYALDSSEVLDKLSTPECDLSGNYLPIMQSSKIRLAHFSVQEYLCSSRILESNVGAFHLSPAREHELLAQSCLTYLLHWCRDAQKGCALPTNLPLLPYSSEFWSHHSLLKTAHSDVTLETELLASSALRQQWLRTYNPLTPWKTGWSIYLDTHEWGNNGFAHSGTFFACLLGLEKVVAALLEPASGICDSEDECGEAFDAALERGHVQILYLLIGRDIAISDMSRRYSAALSYASGAGILELTKLLLARKTDPNEDYSLLVAAHASQSAMIKMLVEAGANVEIEVRSLSPTHDWRGNELPSDPRDCDDSPWTLRHTLCDGIDLSQRPGGRDPIKELVFGDTRLRKPRRRDGTALHIAASKGDLELASLLLAHGADVNIASGHFGSALQAACHYGQLEMAKVLVSRGANVNFQGGLHGSAIGAACINGQADIVMHLVKHGADVNSGGAQYGRDDYITAKRYEFKWYGPRVTHSPQSGGLTPIAAAAIVGHTDLVKFLFKQGAHVQVESNHDGDVFCAAVCSKSIEVLETILSMVKAQGTSPYDLDPALCLAAGEGYASISLKRRRRLKRGGRLRRGRRPIPISVPDSALCSVAANGHLSCVQLLLDAGASPYRRGRDGCPLELALHSNHFDVAKLLIKYGAVDPALSPEAELNADALHIALQKSQWEIAELLLANGADIKMPGTRYNSAVEAAAVARTDACVMVQRLLANGADLTTGGLGVAVAASSQGHLDVVKLVMERGISVVAHSSSHGSALHAAVAANQLRDCMPLIRFLLDHGADVRSRGGMYDSVLQTALAAPPRSVEDALKQLRGRLDERTVAEAVLSHARKTNCGPRDLVKLLIEAGADVNCRGGHYDSALNAALSVYPVDLQLLELLLEHGADVNAPGGQHQTALQASCAVPAQMCPIFLDPCVSYTLCEAGCDSCLGQSDVDVVRLLIARGADVNARGGEDGSALQAACRGNRTGIIRVLLEKGADVNALGGEHGSALQAAAVGPDHRIVQLLLDHGADVNAQGGEYNSAIQAATYRAVSAPTWPRTTLKLLLDHGADVNVQGGLYGSPLQIALSCSHGVGVGDVVKLLLKYGAVVVEA